MAPQQFFQALSQDFGSLLNNQIFSDVRIVVGKTQNTRTFNAHSPILGARSSYFVRALSNDCVKRENNTIIIHIPNIPPRIFEVVLRYIYNGEISLEEHGILAILELLVAADELSLKNLTNYLEDYLIEHHAKMLEENFASLHETSFMHDSFKKLQEFCTQIAAKSPAIIFRSQDFTSLNKSFLSSILSRNDLIMEESQIWEKVVEWGVAKLGSNIDIKEISNWTDENFEAFKEIIEEFLPLIRFFHISSVDFYYKVKPFEKILPETLYEDLLHHYLVPGSHQMSVDAQPLRCSRLNVDSKLLRLHNVEQLDHWIQGKDENTPYQNQLEYDFDLLLRGSRDGFSPADFHRLCDNKGATVSVIKVKGTGQLIGGYTQASWDSRNGFLNGTGSFIFSLGDGKAENAKLSKSISDNGPYGASNRGPEFGWNSIVMKSEDFQNRPGCSYGKDLNYEHTIMPNSENEQVDFFVEEYEVFRIRKHET
ncbi:hypothetical protein G9A89_002654 [Geosiphon pyriformis]|nr:hypothetical protein G9A89_002654 [Geosiphon pyriformis]